MKLNSTVCATILLAFAAAGTSASAQQPSAVPAESTPQAAAPAAQPSAPGPPAAVFGGPRGPRSPEIASDGSVIFRLAAPGATAVTVRGSWQKQREAPLAMAKDASGTWMLKVDALPPELYTYTFAVDGAGMLDPGNVYTMRDGTRYLSALLVPGEGSALYEEGDVPHGAIQQVWYQSPTLDLAQRRMYVYTPAGYETSTAKYPVLYLLHGAGGDEDAWDSMGHAHQIMDHLIASGKAKPMLVVMTNGNFNQTAAPGVTVQAPGNGFSAAGANPNDPPVPGQVAPMQKFADSVVQDVIPFVEKHYRVLTDRDHRAIAGLSMGGAQTAMIGLNHIEKFSYIATFSGAFTLIPGAVKRVPPPAGAPAGGPGGGRGGAQALDPAAVDTVFPGVNSAVNAKLHLLYLSVGLDDTLVGPANQQFMDWLTQKGVVYQKKLVPGYAHVWPFWRISLAEVAPQLFATTAPAHK